MPDTLCPNCDTVINIGQPHEGMTVVCPECNVELEIISTHPLEVDFTEDWQGNWEEE